MYYSRRYESPVGSLLLVSDEASLVGLWIERQKYYAAHMPEEITEKPDHSVLVKAAEWLDRYFSGAQPCIDELPLDPIGSDFRQEVWRILCEIPYGQYTTYGAIAQTLAKRMGKEKMSSQAVGGAVGHNPISIIIPCHRVVGSDGSLTGYASGINRKITLLEHENVDMTGLYVPQKGTAL